MSGCLKSSDLLLAWLNLSIDVRYAAEGPMAKVKLEDRGKMTCSVVSAADESAEVWNSSCCLEVQAKILITNQLNNIGMEIVGIALLISSTMCKHNLWKIRVYNSPITSMQTWDKGVSTEQSNMGLMMRYRDRNRTSHR